LNDKHVYDTSTPTVPGDIIIFKVGPRSREAMRGHFAFRYLSENNNENRFSAKIRHTLKSQMSVLMETPLLSKTFEVWNNE